MRLRALLAALLAPLALGAPLRAADATAPVPEVRLPAAPLDVSIAAHAQAGLAGGVPAAAALPQLPRLPAARLQAASIVEAARMAAAYHLSAPSPVRLLSAAHAGIQREQAPSAGSPAPALTQLRAWARAASGLKIERDDAGGARVTAVAPGSPAHRAGMQPGDVISAVDDVPVDGLPLSDTRSRLSRAALGPLPLRLQRALPSGRRLERAVELRGGERGTKTLLTRLLPVEPRRLEAAAQAGLTRMLAGLDRYSGFIPRDAALDVKARQQGDAAKGFGFTIDPAEPSRIDAVVAGSPAAEAGLRRGDRLVEVGGARVSDEESLDAALAAAGDTVPMIVERDGRRLRRRVTPRAYYNPSASAQALGDGVIFIRISEFNERTPYDLAESLAHAVDEQPRAVVLDLRDNGGGTVPGAMEIASAFIGKRRRIGKMVDRVGELPFVSGGGPLVGLPVAVLINKNSASASEAVAAALKDQAGAVLVGQRSFGKDVAQGYYDLPNGGEAVLTVIRFEAARGTSARGDGRRRGLAPDVAVPSTKSAARGLATTRARSLSSEPVRPEADPALSAALAALRLR